MLREGEGHLAAGRFTGRQDTFMAEKPTLAVEAASVTRELAIRPDNTVAWYDDGDGIVGVGKADGTAGGGFAQSCRKPAIQLAGEIDLPELVALVERSTLVLCNDSAPMHIAAALGRPVVSIFGPTDPRRTGPYQSGESVVRADLPCMPCFYRRIRQCPIQHECMNRVLPDAVLRAVSLKLPSSRVAQP